MKKSNIIIYFAALIFLAACSNAKKLDNFSELGNDKTVIPLKITESKQLIFLTDFYPELDGADSIVCDNANFKLSQNSNNWADFFIETDTDKTDIAELKVWNKNKYLSIIVLLGDIDVERVIFSQNFADGKINLGNTKTPKKIVAMWQNRTLPDSYIEHNESGFAIEIPNEAAKTERSYIRVFACDDEALFNDILIPLENKNVITDAAKLNRHDAHTQVLYSLMIDRFNNGNTNNDSKLNTPEVLKKVDYYGGDIAGITKKINEGFFNNLGINTIWISPITQNPYDAWGLYDDPRTRFSGYHGYWPINITKIDERFGSDAELREMLDAAHAKGLNVLLDYVANHLHIKSPIIQEHPDWVTDSITPDGRRNFELWDEYRLTTWFDTHLATLDLERAEVYEPMTDSALYWIANFDFDGFRHDACKHIPEIYWRTLMKKMKARFPNRQIYQIGETYGSPELINSYVKSGMLDAQFDFNVYDNFIDAIVRPNGSFAKLSPVLQQSLNIYGYHNLMGYITGNHDRARFISLAGGAVLLDEDTKRAGWKRLITVGKEDAYKKLSLLEAFIFSIPGVPCIYQGDEYGVPGGNDPDNRRMMQFDGYNEKETSVKNLVEKLSQLRRNSMPLLYGDFIPLYADDDVLVFSRVYMGENVVVALNKSNEEKTVSVKSPLLKGKVEFLLSEDSRNTIGVGGTVSVNIAPLSFIIVKMKTEN